MRLSHQTRLVLQAMLDVPDEEVWGFRLSQATNLKAGTLYPILQRLLREGWVSARWEDVDEHAVQRRRRRYYRLTALGEQQARTATSAQAEPLRLLMPGWAP